MALNTKPQPFASFKAGAEYRFCRWRTGARSKDGLDVWISGCSFIHRAAQGIGAGLLTARLGIKASTGFAAPLPSLTMTNYRLEVSVVSLSGPGEETLQKAKRPAKNNTISGADPGYRTPKCPNFPSLCQLIVD